MNKNVIALSLALVWFLPWAASPSAQAAERFIAANGTPSGAGTLNDPWSIDKLADNTVGAPGDIIWMRGGTYYWPHRGVADDRFQILLDNGSAAQPITVRNYNDERVTIDGGLRFQGSPGQPGSAYNVRVWGLEVMVSEDLTESRVTTGADYTSQRAELARPNGAILLTGGNVSLINCVIHHNTTNGISAFSNSGGEIYGCISYLNGYYSVAWNRGVAHGIYCHKTASETAAVEQLISIRNAGSPLDFWGSYDPPPVTDFINTTVRQCFSRRGQADWSSRPAGPRPRWR